LICNGHVYPEVEQLKTEAGYALRKLLYKNRRKGTFGDVSFDVRPRHLGAIYFAMLRLRRL
jgi:hypothetical protein